MFSPGIIVEEIVARISSRGIQVVSRLVEVDPPFRAPPAFAAFVVKRSADGACECIIKYGTRCWRCKIQAGVDEIALAVKEIAPKMEVITT